MNEYEMQMEIYNNLLNVPSIDAVDYEVSIGGHYADIVYLENDEMHALELKLTWCTRGLEQAKFYQMYGANYATVVTRKQRVPKKHLLTFEEHGVGLAFFIPSKVVDVHLDFCHYPQYTGFQFPLEWILKPIKIPDDATFTKRLKNKVEFRYGEKVTIWKAACTKRGLQLK